MNPCLLIFVSGKVYFLNVRVWKINNFYKQQNMNNAQTAAKLIEYADRCIAAYDAADPSDRSAAMKRALCGVLSMTSRL